MQVYIEFIVKLVYDTLVYLSCVFRQKCAVGYAKKFQLYTGNGSTTVQMEKFS